MRQYIINQMHKRIMNADETANLEYPQWKRRCWAVGGFVALRVHTIVAIALIPVGIFLILALKIGELAQEIYGLFVEILGANYRNTISDVRGCTNIWKGEYGRGKLLPERPEMRIKNPTAKPIPIED